MTRAGELIATQRLLGALTGSPVRVVGRTRLGGDGAPVERLTLDADHPGVGSTVVVKTGRSPDGSWTSHGANLRNERAALEFLATCGLDIAARLLAADDERGVVVLSDLGSEPSIADLLFGADRSAAEAGLVALAAATGRLHASARDARAAGLTATRWFLDRPLDRWPQLCAAVDELGFPRPAGVSEDLALIGEALREPRFQAFSHGDLTPDNAILTGDGVRFVDFETAGFRHVGLDAACLRLPFPQYRRWAVLPAGTLAAMDSAYRARLVDGCAAAGDDRAYEAAMAAGAAAWTLVRVSRLRLIASRTQRPADALRRRTQIIQTMLSFVDIAERAGRFGALVAWLVALADDMRQRWPEAHEPPREFPAFAASRADTATPRANTAT